MLTSERQWKLKEAHAELELVMRDLPLMLLTLKDAQKASESAGPVSGGDMSDPTLAAVVAAEARGRELDRGIVKVHDAAASLGRLRQAVLGHDGVSVPTVEEQADVCELHRLVLVEDEAAQGLQGYNREIGEVPANAEGVPVGRRWVVDGDGKRRVCRWCGDFFDRAGRLPFLVEVRHHIEGRRVHPPAKAPTA